jgi:hypothetical protein
MSTYEFVSPILPNYRNAQAIQSLTLQDLKAGKFDNPTATANPDELGKVLPQIAKLAEYSDRYNGYAHEDGSLIAFSKTNEWFSGDEAPFIDNVIARKSLLAISKLRGRSLNPKQFGVFALVVSDELPVVDQYEIIHDLLSRAIGRAGLNSATLVNIVLHENDPAKDIALDLGFTPIGSGVASGAPGLIQQRYQRSVE